ncbi:hypothetical protein GCM10010401_02630 [Rarobacter faecitabidus]|uniref:Uncharacterized protein n=1 Tax=Rarobacter faecitabidus TaxID=13243 RepID=A0A542ZWA8_RARFA|nr:hypothetical protein [Rarobacter faecitabidus]TQL64602.1 hypothetical protein FB461_1111 [Rarobacter faecitabidus]
MTEKDASRLVPGGASARAPQPAILLTQIASAEALAATCALHDLEILAFDSELGAFGVTDADSAPTVARTLSAAVSSVPFLELSVRDDRLSAHRWENGEQGEDVPAALILDSLPERVEQVLLGQATDADLSAGVRASSLGRWKTMRILAKSSRRSRGDREVADG